GVRALRLDGVEDVSPARQGGDLLGGGARGGVTTIPAELLLLADKILLNSSGGKDSQATASHICRLAHDLGILDRVVIAHADLGDTVEWDGTRHLAEEQARLLGVRFETVRADGGDLLARTIARFHTLKTKAEREAREQGRDPTTVTVPPAWPSSSARWCTSDLKRGPIRKLMTRLVNELGLGRPARILNCLGQRAAESAPRAKLATVEIDRPASNGRRHVTTWRPIHGWSDAAVWKEIARSGLPYHEAYDWGMSRLSCTFCVLGCEADVVLAARLRPQKAAHYITVETKVGTDFKHGLSMRQIVERANALNAEHGPLRRPTRGTALSRYVGKNATTDYLNRVDHHRLSRAA
ncbi:phosphoadenosine phosphosulfate reductase family protein, partial [Streptomyces sp. NPDC091278]|uniref:phosphoadenosine phosphosulfate reductase domain-containing protein n=1 Tax=Streptomyces sp. NPDC091278 TaxID=3155301 RepID=UPI00344D3A64